MIGGLLSIYSAVSKMIFIQQLFFKYVLSTFFILVLGTIANFTIF